MPNNPKNNPLLDDLEHIFSKTQWLWEELCSKQLFITGATGFFGKWILESFAWAKNKLNFDTEVIFLTRDYNSFNKEAPHLANNPAIKFHIGDIRNFQFPDGEFHYIIHLASASAEGWFKKENTLSRFHTIVEGTRHVLDFAVQCNAKKILYTSSGNVYGKQPSNMTHIPEDYCGVPALDDPNATLGIGKRAAELLCVNYAQQYGIDIKIARCFSFVGPYLQLDIHYAIGNFIRNALNGGPIYIKGDGTPYRSYLYASDLAIWLWTILLRGESCRAYNVGSEEAISIKDLAYLVASCFDKPIEVKIMGTPDPTKPAERYVPSTLRARNELGLEQTINLKDSINKTIGYYKQKIK